MSRSHQRIIIGHRGACGHRPEHTLASYELGIELGADFVETDIVPTRDGVLICRHENELSRSTDISSRAEFAQLRTQKKIEGVETTGWFSEDLTFVQTQMLRAIEPLEDRDHAFNGKFKIPSLAELLELVLRKRQSGTRAGLIIEVKHPAYFAGIGLDIAPALLRILRDQHCTGPDAPVIVESFEVSILRQIHEQAGVRIIQLLDAENMAPADLLAAGSPVTFGQMMTAKGQREIARYAFAIGPWKRLIVPAQSTGDEMGDRVPREQLGAPTDLIDRAHDVGLDVHAWTFRDEQRHLAANYLGDPYLEYEQFLKLGLDGFIADSPDTARAAMQRFQNA